jgi:hypothetical protein
MDRFSPLGPASVRTHPETVDDVSNTPDSLETGQAEEVGQRDSDRLAYIKSVVPPKKTKRKWPRLVFMVVVGLGMIVACYFSYLHTMHAHKATPKTNAKRAHLLKPGTDSDVTSQYISNGNDLNLSFAYPSDWGVTPASNDNSDDKTITVTSPIQMIIDSAGRTVSGKVVVTIRPLTTSMTELSGDQITAAQTSTQFAYANPTGSQFRYPYLTYLNLLGGSNASSAFQEVVITGNMSYTQGQSIMNGNISVDPIITASFDSCSTVACNGTFDPLSITNQTWQNDNIFQQTESLFTSLALH